MTLRHLGTAAALVAAAVCAGCSGAGHSSLANPTHSATIPSSAPAAPALRLSTVKLHRDGDVGPVAFNSSGDIVWTEGPKSANWNRVELLHRGASTPRTVAQSAWREGLINWVAMAGRWVVYVDQSAEQRDTAPNVDWVVHADNLDTQQKVVLAKSPRANPWVPNVYAGDGGVVWATASPSRNADLWRWVPGTPVSATEKVLSDSELTPDSLTPTKNGIVYLGPNGEGIRGHTLGGDCWIAPYDGSAPKALTHTALGMSCAVGGDTLVYSLHIDPSQPTKEEIADDPHEIWTQPLTDGARGRRIERGYIQARPLVGDGFATWVDTTRRVVSTFDGSHRQFVSIGDGSGLDDGARGDTFATDRTHEDGTTTMRLTTVHRDG